MSGHRQAAVALHALAAADRTLILAELPETDQATLRGYLTELDELGFDSGAATDLLPRRGAGAGPVPSAANDEAADALADAAAADVHAVLEGEPASLVAQLLSVEAWTWRADFLTLQTAPRREQLRACAPDGAVAPARAAFLRRAVSERLQRLPAAASPAPAAAPARPLWMRIRLPWTR